MPYKQECIAVEIEGVLQGSFSLRLRVLSQESTAIRMGAYCRTNQRYIAVLLRHVVRVGGSQTLSTCVSEFAPDFHFPGKRMRTRACDCLCALRASRAPAIARR